MEMVGRNKMTRRNAQLLTKAVRSRLTDAEIIELGGDVDIVERAMGREIRRAQAKKAAVIKALRTGIIEKPHEIGPQRLAQILERAASPDFSSTELTIDEVSAFDNDQEMKAQLDAALSWGN